MEFYASLPASIRRTDCAIIGMFDDGTIAPDLKGVSGLDASNLTALHKTGDFGGRLGETLLLPPPSVKQLRVLLVGLGAPKALTRRHFRRVLKEAAQVVSKTSAKEVACYLSAIAVTDTSAYYRARYTAELFSAALYKIPDLKTAKKPKPSSLSRIACVVLDSSDLKEAERGARAGAAVGVGQSFSKDLANLPANVCTPTYLGTAAQKLARSSTKLHAQVLGPVQIKRLKMGSFLSVTRGSEEPPRLIVLEYRGGPRGQAPIVLVGKGVTFDTGGISLKDPGAMDEMKFDMSGAATVLGTIAALADAKASINVTAVVVACENMPSGRATKPGDIVTSMSGQTIEVLNTDAEGRLILCDAITYSRRLKPSVIIDVATLTGACVVALGSLNSGLFANDDDLANALLDAGNRTADTAWRLPLSEDYADQLRSNFADMANIGGREAGAITAAAFLAKFATGLRWAHLDIAGSGYVSGAAKSSTGRPVSLLVDYCLSQA